VYEDGQIYTLMDYQPVTAGHVVVVPRVHVALLDDLDEEVGAAMFRIAHRLTRALRRSGLRQGVNLFFADGAAAFQEIPHVFPRYKGVNFTVDADRRIRDRQELDDAAARVRAGLAELEA
jgi:histidine triad (HIT) family protein